MEASDSVEILKFFYLQIFGFSPILIKNMENQLLIYNSMSFYRKWYKVYFVADIVFAQRVEDLGSISFTKLCGFISLWHPHIMSLGLSDWYASVSYDRLSVGIINVIFCRKSGHSHHCFLIPLMINIFVFPIHTTSKCVHSQIRWLQYTWHGSGMYQIWTITEFFSSRLDQLFLMCKFDSSENNNYTHTVFLYKFWIPDSYRLLSFSKWSTLSLLSSYGNICNSYANFVALNHNWISIARYGSMLALHSHDAYSHLLVESCCGGFEFKSKVTLDHPHYDTVLAVTSHWFDGFNVLSILTPKTFSFVTTSKAYYHIL